MFEKYRRGVAACMFSSNLIDENVNPGQVNLSRIVVI
jgi:hypothetical protein